MVLGSASWRLSYGLRQETPKNQFQIKNLLEFAASMGISWIDTAQTYGDSEKIIGELKPGLKIATKIEFKDLSEADLSRQIQASTYSLKRELLDLVFIHDWDSLSNSEKFTASTWLDKSTQSGQIRAWGLSSYEAGSLLEITEYTNSPIVFQINCNLLDQRLPHIIKNASSIKSFLNNGEIWLRSVFLQGLLINQDLTTKFSGHSDLKRFFSYCKEQEIHPIALALGFIKSLPFCDKVVLGTSSVSELSELLMFEKNQLPTCDWSKFNSVDLTLIDPRRWGI